PVDRKLGQDLERRALAGARADLLEVEATDTQKLRGDAVLRLLRAAGEPVLVLGLLIFVEALAVVPWARRLLRLRFAPGDAGHFTDIGRLRIESVAAA